MSVSTKSRSRMVRHFTAAMAVLFLAACGKGKEPQPAADPEAQLMQRGVALLYQSNDPIGAEAVFRQVLQQHPAHYGAQYQLAVAVDRGGRPTEARALWETVLRNAQAASDSATASIARTRLAAPDTASQAGMMAFGLDLLYRQNNPTAAADQFRKILGGGVNRAAHLLVQLTTHQDFKSPRPTVSRLTEMSCKALSFHPATI